MIIRGVTNRLGGRPRRGRDVIYLTYDGHHRNVTIVRTAPAIGLWQKET